MSFALAGELPVAGFTRSFRSNPWAVLSYGAVYRRGISARKKYGAMRQDQAYGPSSAIGVDADGIESITSSTRNSVFAAVLLWHIFVPGCHKGDVQKSPNATNADRTYDGAYSRLGCVYNDNCGIIASPDEEQFRSQEKKAEGSLSESHHARRGGSLKSRNLVGWPLIRGILSPRKGRIPNQWHCRTSETCTRARKVTSELKTTTT